MDKHWLGHRDLVIKGERPDELGGASIDVRQSVGKSCPSLDLDFGSECLQHVIEKCDLVEGIAARAISGFINFILCLCIVSCRQSRLRGSVRRLLTGSPGNWSIPRTERYRALVIPVRRTR